MAGAVVAALVLVILLPDGERIGPSWLLPLLAGLLLVALFAGDPGKIDRRSNVLRVISIALVSILVLNSLWATAQLIDALINGGKETNSAGDLLAAGTTVWISNCLAFALLYWELDSGGAAARAHRIADHVDIAFPQQLNPDIGPQDGGHGLSITSTWASRTRRPSARPTRCRWRLGKIAMTVQSLISLALLGLVIARAVNVFA